VTLVLATATPLEMRAALKNLETDRDAMETVPERGAVQARLAGREAFLVVTGVGPVNAALEIGRVLGRFDVSGVVHVGLAGSFDADSAPLGSAVLASAEVFPEYGVAGDDGLALTDGDFAFAQRERGEQKIFQAIELKPDAAAATLGLSLPLGISRGTFLTVAGVTGTRRRALERKSRHGALAENMEGFALALAAFAENVPYIELRTISNDVGERDWSKWVFEKALGRLGDTIAGLFA